MPSWVASAVAYRDAKRSGGAEVSSSEDKVPDRATVEAAVKAGEVVAAPEGVDGAKPADKPVEPPVEAAAENPAEAAAAEPTTNGADAAETEAKPVVDGAGA